MINSNKYSIIYKENEDMYQERVIPLSTWYTEKNENTLSVKLEDVTIFIRDNYIDRVSLWDFQDKIYYHDNTLLMKILYNFKERSIPTFHIINTYNDKLYKLLLSHNLISHGPEETKYISEKLHLLNTQLSINRITDIFYEETHKDLSLKYNVNISLKKYYEDIIKLFYTKIMVNNNLIEMNYIKNVFYENIILNYSFRIFPIFL